MILTFYLTANMIICFRWFVLIFSHFPFILTFLRDYKSVCLIEGRFIKIKKLLLSFFFKLKIKFFIDPYHAALLISTHIIYNNWKNFLKNNLMSYLAEVIGTWTIFGSNNLFLNRYCLSAPTNCCPKSL